MNKPIPAITDWEQKLNEIWDKNLICTGCGDDFCYVETIKAFIESELQNERERIQKENNQYFAYCVCGDALERKELYPNEATYYCFGCDKTFRLTKTEKEETHNPKTCGCIKLCYMSFNKRKNICSCKHGITEEEVEV